MRSAAVLGLAVALAAAGIPPAADETTILLRAIDAETGIDFLHVRGATGEKYLVETMGSGVALFDYDGDGDLDVYLVNGGVLPGFSGPRVVAGSLFRNDGAARFVDVTAVAGLVHEGYGMAAVAADIDNDGDADLYVTHYGPNRLFRNNGDGTFTDATARAGVGNPLWSASAAWADLDADGAVDLYVTSYLDWSVENHPDCSQRGLDGVRIRAYCLPDPFSGLPDAVYRNRGDGSFEDRSAAAGVARRDGKGLGVVAFDADDDGRVDLYVANDTVPNFLFRNEGGFRFTERGLEAGVAYDADGNALAGMGVDAADADGDGDLDLFVTNFEGETNTLYRNEANGFFTDVTARAGLARPTLRPLGFGTAFADLDDDGLPELLVANGHIFDNAERLREDATWAQPNQLFRNDGDLRFSEIPWGDDRVPRVSRGLAVGDLDGDGDLDVVVTSSGGRPEIWRNDTAGDGAVRLLLVGRRANRDALGARVEFAPPTGGSTRPVYEVKAGSSYLSQSERTVHVGLGGAARAELRVRWPGGPVEEIGPVDAGTLAIVVEGRGVVASFPFGAER